MKRYFQQEDRILTLFCCSVGAKVYVDGFKKSVLEAEVSDASKYTDSNLIYTYLQFDQLLHNYIKHNNYE